MNYSEFKKFITGTHIRQLTSYASCPDKELRKRPAEAVAYTIKRCKKDHDRDCSTYATLTVTSDGTTEKWHIMRYVAECLFQNHAYQAWDERRVVITYELV